MMPPQELVVEAYAMGLPVPFHRYRRYNSSTARWVVSSATTRARMRAQQNPVLPYLDTRFALILALE
jgi:hypothetical protein